MDAARSYNVRVSDDDVVMEHDETILSIMLEL